MLKSLPRVLLATCLALSAAGALSAAIPPTSATDWPAATELGDYVLAVQLSGDDAGNTALSTLLQAARTAKLASDPQWLRLLHYKTGRLGGISSQIDAQYFFMSDKGKQDPQAELDATLAAFFSNTAKPPLRLTPYCRFVARRYWLEEQLGELAELLPQRSCPEFETYANYLDAASLTLIFPTAHPNSPSSAFGHTLLRIDKENQRPESRLLNMSINFAAEIPQDVSSAAYAINGLNGGFPGKFKMLPYHMKLREYGQIENRDTWEYPLTLDKPSVDLVLRHAYELLISHFDYYFFSENCSYHLLSLLEVATPSEPLTDDFGLWTIPVDTIRLLRERGLADEGRFTPSSIRLLRAKRDAMNDEDRGLALQALENDLPSIDAALSQLSDERQVGVLDLLSDYERYERLKSDPSAQGSNTRERAILSRRSKLGIQTEAAAITTPEFAPDTGHGTSRVSLQYSTSKKGSDIAELQLRPAYHDFRDPSAAFDGKAAIQMGLIGLARDLEQDKFFLRRFTLLSIQSIEPRGEFFKPVSWHTNVEWLRPEYKAHHEFTFNVGGGAAFQSGNNRPVVFFFGEGDLVDAPARDNRQQLRLGASIGTHWEPVNGLRFGAEWNYRQEVGGGYYESIAELWAGFAITPQLSLNLDTELVKTAELNTDTRATLGIRAYF
ncbi:DUF4105 domain-containing protein [Granulosicoccus antarcticus]|uniref:Uncharacterized protein n=1 Tax=Granulosicoccus antarcticus IMCC3135 TaxID=1192854 RepID=A0A2Z2NRE6_9GAMM|nr:DUF4105 domain-containing protein [Granulosicoccus antarcticus]ASJ72581.1 hypothetical protein IMCC3135_12465 [Granulosicoccus antarcticus IMCC3135]